MKHRLFYIFFFCCLSLAVKAQPPEKIIDLDYNQPRHYILGGLTVSGLQFLSSDGIIALTGLKVGDEVTIPGDQISNAIKRIWDEGVAGDIQVSVTKLDGYTIYLDIQLKELPRISDFSFNRTVRKGEATDLLEKIGYLKGQKYTSAIEKNAEQKVRKFFMEKGYHNASVDVTSVKDSLLANHVLMKVTVDRGEKVKVFQVLVEGNDSLSDASIRKKMKKTKGQNLNFLASHKFSRDLFEKDKQAVLDYYYSKGFRDVTLSDTTYFAPLPYPNYYTDVLSHPDNYKRQSNSQPIEIKDRTWKKKENKSKLTVQLNVKEGRQYYFRNISWKGNYLYSTSRLDSILNIKRGQVYDMDALERKLSFNPYGADISSLYLDNGYLFFNIDPAEILVEGDSIDVEIRIYEGKQATIKNVYVSGNTKTHDHVILRELRTLPGQKFSRSDLINSQRELSVLGYFDPEKIEINPVPNPQDGTVDIHYKVEEKPNDQIQLSAGYGGSRRFNAFGYGGFIGTLGLVFNNFSLRNLTNTKTWDPLPSGDGQRFSINAQSSGRGYQNYSMSFTEPWFGGRKPVALSMGFSHARINVFPNTNLALNSFNTFNNIGTSSEKQHLDITTINLGLGRRLRWPDWYFNLNNSLSYSLYHLDNYNRFGSINFSDGFSNNFSFITQLSRNNIDENNFPKKGSSMSFSVSLTPPYSLFNNINYQDATLPAATRYRWIEYHKWMFDNEWYTTLIPASSKNGRALVLRAKCNFGFMGGYNKETGIGPFERFIMGGSGLTGFYSNFIGVDYIGLRGYDNNAISPSALGGTIFDKFTMELRYPLATSQALSVSVLGFFEAGNTWDSFANFNPLNTYRSVGLGANIFMPAFGLIGLNYGWPMDPIPGDPSPYKPRFTFTIGQQLR